MQFFVGIVPPREYKEKIVRFQRNWKNNGVVEVVEPHITLKAQGGLTPDLGWLAELEELCRDFPPFEIALREPKFFGDYVVYLSMESQRLHELHAKIVKLIQPSADLVKKYFELDDFVPHMTLGKTFFGMSADELREMAVQSRSLLAPYPAFTVDYIRVYREAEPMRYVPYKDVPLKR